MELSGPLLAWKVAPAGGGMHRRRQATIETLWQLSPFIQALHDAGLPDGVLNAVTGPSAEVSHALITARWPR